MNQTTKTTIYVAVAVVTAVLAALAMPDRGRPGETTIRQDPFYPTFQVGDITEVEILTYSDGETQSLLVKREEGLWTIPSHDGYPADADRQLARTVGEINGLVRQGIHERGEKKFPDYGVVDPTNPGYAAGAYGRRIIVKGKDRVLADLVIGKELANNPGLHFVRKQDERAVYSAEVDPSRINARFSDWVETDLLEIGSAKITRVESTTRPGLPEDYELGPATRLERQNGAWVLPGVDTAVEEFDKSAARNIVSDLKELELVDVERKPQEFVQIVETLKKEEPGTRDFEIAEFQRGHGFFIRSTDEGYDLGGEEGLTRVDLSDGVRYTLHWGDVSYETAEDPDPAATPADSPLQGQERMVENRYLWVEVSFDEALLGPKPVEPQKPDPPQEPADEPEADATDQDTAEDDETGEEETDEPDAMAQYEKAMEEYEEELADYNEKASKARERVKELRHRFDEWFYIVDSEAYDTVHFDRDDLVEPVPEEPEAEETEGDPGEAEEPATGTE
jgi:hypothetical protein